MRGRPEQYERPHWYACYTRARHEKRVREQLERREWEIYLPLVPRKSKWKDRTKIVHFPMFPSYVFARFALRDLYDVLSVPGVVDVVRVDGAPAIVREEDLENIRRFTAVLIDRGEEALRKPLPEVGQRVRVVAGPFEGVEGVVVERRGRRRLLVGLELIGQGLEVDLPGDVVKATAA